MTSEAAVTRDQWRSWRELGYVLLPGAVEPELVQRVTDSLWSYLGMDRDRPQTWYDQELRGASGIDNRGMVPFFHDQAIWDCRQSPKLYEAFCALQGRRDLLVSIDRLNMNPPVGPNWHYEGFIHWDIDVGVRPVRSELQGLLCLSDTPDSAGGFQCAPGFHTIIEEWLDRQPPGYRTRFPDTEGMRLVTIPMRAGDFLIWHGALPHGNSPNRSTRPRLAQYITMKPANEVGDEEQAARLRSFSAGEAPHSPMGKILPLGRQQSNTQVNLTELGRLLLGIEPWTTALIDLAET